LSELSVDTGALTALANQFPAARGILARYILATMQAGLNIFEEAVAVETPVGATGNLRSGLATEVYGRPLEGELLGKLSTPAVYGYAVEFGQPPGTRPPVDELEYWVIRKLGVDPAAAQGVAYAIAETIYRKGTQGAFMFKRGFDARRQAAIDLWQRMLGDFAVEAFS